MGESIRIKKPRNWHRAVLAIAIALTLLTNTHWADETKLHTGKAFRQALAEPVELVTWNGITLRASLGRITQNQRIAVMLDRRIDPDQTIEFSVKQTPLETMIDRLAQKYGAEALPCWTCRLRWTGRDDGAIGNRHGAAAR